VEPGNALLEALPRQATSGGGASRISYDVREITDNYRTPPLTPPRKRGGELASFPGSTWECTP